MDVKNCYMCKKKIEGEEGFEWEENIDFWKCMDGKTWICNDCLLRTVKELNKDDD